VCTRDVVFNEKEVFDRNFETLKSNLATVDLEQLKEWLNARDRPNDRVVDEEEHQEEGPVVETSTTNAHEDEGVIEVPDQAQDQEVDNTGGNSDDEAEDCIIVKGDDAGSFYPTPPPSPPSDIFAAAFAGLLSPRNNMPAGERRQIEAWQAAFHAGTLSSQATRPDGTTATRASILRSQLRPKSKSRLSGPPSGSQTITADLLERLRNEPGGLATLHQSTLTPPPQWPGQLKRHPLKTLFQQAEQDHLRSHSDMESWTEVSRPRAGNNQQVLGCRWVYTYKFNTRGFLAKCKARLVVRGDQQAKGLAEDNYSATLAIRSLRATLAIAARFDLELIQFDAVNAFVNAKIDEDILMEMPGGHRKPGKVLKLEKALYGLRKSPLLWQNELKSTLVKLGFKPAAHEPCMMTKDGIIVFYYVDDIVIAYRKEKQGGVNAAVEGLKSKYKLTGGHELRWFLGIEVHRDRKKRKIWLSQTAYIEKIAKLTQSEANPRTPMITKELLPYSGTATPGSVNLYQRKVGSVLYAAVTTRPDTSFAISRLARFNQNPGPEHHEAVDRVLRYLYVTRFLALELGGGDQYRVASDASFADNSLDRKSSQGYAITLFGGIIAWRASKQDTVTTSTTEAELLALAQAAKEGMFVQRLLNDMSVKLDDNLITLECDNAQTIRLVQSAVTTLQTKLRHVDIHNHWLRQEAQQGRIRVEYMPSNKMIADGLTKALSVDKHQGFVTMLNLVPIQSVKTTMGGNANPAESAEA
jgi:hypothetical protein